MKYHQFKLATLTVLLSSFLTACGGGSDNKEAPAAKKNNQLPTINAIEDVSIKEREPVAINASASDIDGSIVTYSWSQVSGTVVELEEESTSKLAFFAPSIAVDEVLTFSLTVTDNNGGKATQSVTINVEAYADIDETITSDAGLLACAQKQNADIGITTLSCDGYKIADLSGLDDVEGLTKLSLTNAELDNLTGLNTLTELVYLDLSNNMLNNDAVSDLSELTKLEKLNLSYNNITVLPSIFSNMVNLKELTLYEIYHMDYYWGAEIDLSAFSENTQLEALLIKKADSYNAQSLSKNVKLSNLELIQADISSVSFLLDLINLEKLNLARNFSLKDISAVLGLVNLKSLDLSYTDVDSLAALKALSNLESLRLADDSYQPLDLSTIAHLVNLKTLDLAGGENYTNHSALSVLENLEYLNVSESNLSNLAFISDYKQIKQLVVAGNSRISDLSPLKDLTDLIFLDISNSQNLSDLTPLSSLTNLKELKINNLYRNSSIDITPLSSLVNLEKMDLSYNEYDSLDSITNLTNLSSLTLNNVYYDEFATLPALEGLERLSYFEASYLKSNALSNLASAKSLTHIKVKFASDVTDLAALDTLINLKKIEILDAPALTDISALSSMQALEELVLKKSKVESLGALLELGSIKKIMLQSNNYLTCSTLDALSTAQPTTVITYFGDCVELPVSELQIADENLKQCVADKRVRDALKLTSLYCYSSYEISNFSGIEGFENLSRLEVTISENTDLSPLSSLDKLTQLEIHRSNNVDLSSLTATSLTSLSVNYSSIKSLGDDTAKLVNLKSLNLSNNNLSILPSLTRFSSVESLNLRWNDLTHLTNVDVLQGLTNIDLDYNDLTNIDALHLLPIISRVDLYGNDDLPCDDVERLKDKTSINYVSASQCN
ncbi:leucine-rich repeat domain-containing protein [Flocculibacter collagenilyticus]|uniref:leucine-rich repeat domain-containing protein n=1 Tax=Flocculibacter collagenilyticus TaxID=2744479 RepID=UPI0018F42A09|nr:hypothetical protein [Flocculibacter collagenilyticus]